MKRGRCICGAYRWPDLAHALECPARPKPEHTATPAELAREDELHQRAMARRRGLRAVPRPRPPLPDRLRAAKLVLGTAHAQLADLLLCLDTDQRARAVVEAEKLCTTLGLASVAAADLLPEVRRLARGAGRR